MPILAQLDSLLASPSWEVLLYVFIFVSIFFYAMSSKKGKIITFFISLYLSIFIFISFPYFNFFFANNLNSTTVLLYEIAVFAVFMFIFNIFLIKIGISESSFSKSKWYEAVLFSVLGTGLIINLFFHFFNIGNIYEFSSMSEYLFSSGNLFFWWILAPFPALFFFRR